MSTATLQRTDNAFASIAADNDNFDINEGHLDIHIRRAVARMIDFCQNDQRATPFLARGMVIDTLGNIEDQVRSYFPAYIDVTPIMDDMVLVVTNSAKKNRQRFQEVTLSYVADGKIPDVKDANRQNFVKWYSVDGASNEGGFDGLTKSLKPGWSGGAGGSGTDMLKHLSLGSKKGFLLVSASLDITDQRVQEQIADMNIVQAFGTNPATLNAVADTIAAGGAPAKQMEAVAQNLVDVKNLKAELTNAQGTPKAEIIATALAMKVEALSVTLPTLPANIAQSVSRHVDKVKTDMGAHQMARAVEALSVAALPANNVTTASVIKSVDAVVKVAEANGLKVSDVINLVMTKSAPPALVEPVAKLMATLSKPEVLPAIERSVPYSVGASIRADLVTPPLALAASTPIAMEPVVSALRTMSENTASPTLAQAASMLETTMPSYGGQSTMPPTQAIQTVVDNLQAMNLSQHTPPEVKAQLALVTPVLEAMAIQSRDPQIAPGPVQPGPVQPGPAQPAPINLDFIAPTMPAPAPVMPTSTPVDVQPVAPINPVTPTQPEPVGAGGGGYRAPERLPDQAPIVTVTIATGLPAPSHVAPTTIPAGEIAKDVKPAPKQDGAEPVQLITPVKDEKIPTHDHKDKVEDGPGCNGKRCKSCFTKACNALTEDKVAQLERRMGIAPKPIAA